MLFDKNIYIERREILKKRLGSGLVIFFGNNDSPVNYPSNIYKFRQDSSFLYFYGQHREGLVGVIDIDNDKPSKISFPDWCGTLIGINIDNGTEKLRITFPFETEIPSGKHNIAVTVYGHRRNALGPFYLNEKWPERTGPYQFKVYEHPERQLVPAGLISSPIIHTQ